MRAITEPAEVAALVAKESQEDARITIWLLIPETVRRLAMAISNLPDERANDDLRTFSRLERAHITTALRHFMTDMSMAETCMRDTSPTTTVLH